MIRLELRFQRMGDTLQLSKSVFAHPQLRADSSSRKKQISPKNTDYFWSSGPRQLCYAIVETIRRYRFAGDELPEENAILYGDVIKTLHELVLRTDKATAGKWATSIFGFNNYGDPLITQVFVKEGRRNTLAVRMNTDFLPFTVVTIWHEEVEITHDVDALQILSDDLCEQQSDVNPDEATSPSRHPVNKYKRTNPASPSAIVSSSPPSQTEEKSSPDQERDDRKPDPLITSLFDQAIAPVALQERMADCTRRTLARMTDLNIYRPKYSVWQSEVDANLDAFLQGSRPLLVVEGVAGAGKSTVLCRLAARCIDENIPVLFETTDHLSAAAFPESLSLSLGIKGDFTSDFQHLGDCSSGLRVVIIIDDARMFDDGMGTLISLLHWAERLPANQNVRLVTSIRTNQLNSYLRDQGLTLSPVTAHRYALPPFNRDQLLKLAEVIPVAPHEDRAAVLSTRCEVASRLSDLSNILARPALAVAILELSGPQSVPSGFSAELVYTELFMRHVLGVVDGVSQSQTPFRATLLRRIAALMAARRTTRLSLDDETLGELLDARTGRRSVDYQALLDNRLLVESLDNLTTYVSFTDDRMFSFVAAMNYSADDISRSLSSLGSQIGRFSAINSIAAFLLIRAVKTKDAQVVADALKTMATGCHSILLEIALLDGKSFIVLFTKLIAQDGPAAQYIIEALLSLGEMRLAVHAAQLMIDGAGTDPTAVDRARFIKAKSLFECDEYDAAEEQLEGIRAKSNHHLAVAAHIAVARGDFHRARDLFEKILRRIENLTPAMRTQALAGLGYVQERLRQYSKAEKSLRDAMKLVKNQGDQRRLCAEIWGDLGQVLMSTDRPGDAKICFQNSMAINQQLGFVIGIGIVEGLLGQVDFALGDFQNAALRLQKAYDIACRLSNRWRQAWSLDLLAELHKKTGKVDDETECRRRSSQLKLGIGVERQ
jgi:tetratricopeptide (TPR) repeat protein